MPRRTETSDIVDGLLRAITVGAITGTAILAPNAIQLFDKPLQRYFKRLDKEKRQREYKRLLAYMHRHQLVTGHYEHGLKITDKARKRLEKASIDTLQIPLQTKWDKTWRIIFYDIPEAKKAQRDQLAFRLRKLGCQQLQRSVWVHPFPCDEQLNTLAIAFALSKHVTYMETTHINNEKALIKRFSHLL